MTTLTGDSIGMRDLIAYYLDTNINMPGFTAVGKNIMILKAYEVSNYRFVNNKGLFIFQYCLCVTGVKALITNKWALVHNCS